MSFLPKCRICKSKKLIRVGGLGDITISDFTDKPKQGKKYPLNLVYCKECTLLQLDYTTPRNLLYKNYWYQSHLNPVIVDDLKEIAKLVKGQSHIDIGGNDGTLLKYSKAKDKTVVDPSNIIPNGYAFINDYWENVKPGGEPIADTITAIACLYDLPDPNKFIQNIKKALKEDGIFIAQLMTLEPMIENNDIGNICHEHIEYYSYKSLVRLYEQNGLEIYKVEKNKINGGSYRLFARHFKKGSIPFKEKEYGVKELKDFFKRTGKNKHDFLKWFTENSLSNAHWMITEGYGASTKANTILQYYGVELTIIDINPSKFKKYPITGHFPIQNKISPLTEYLWVFPWGFLDYFKKKEKRYKGKWITTIPKFKIYD